QDTAATLAARLLSQEHLIYPRAIARLLSDL
ncbi:MAG: phosphoribosylglycinamide formyltransferase, partial [Ramlibacter sp.]